MKKIKLLFHRDFYDYILPIVLTISFAIVMFWERNIPINSLGFCGVISLFWLYNLLKKHQSVKYIGNTLELEQKIIALFSSAEHFLYIVTHNLLLVDNRLKFIYKAKNNGALVSILVYSETLLNKSIIDELKKLQSKVCTINHKTIFNH